MNKNSDDLSDYTGQQTPGINASSPGEGSADKRRREPVFTGFDDEAEDGFEEPDRDTDYTSSFREVDPDEEEFEDTLLEEDEEFVVLHEQNSKPSPADSWNELGLDLEEDDDLDLEEEDEALWQEMQAPTHAQGSLDDADSYVEDEPVYTERREQEQEQEQEQEYDNHMTDSDNDDWPDEEEYPEEDGDHQQQWPLGLIIVTVVALLLLVAGGYGVIQQRSATQEEIRQLQATLATAASPAEVNAARDALATAEQRNTELQAAVDALTLENRRLSDTATGLESQLEAQQAALAKQQEEPATATLVTKEPPAITAKPITAKPVQEATKPAPKAAGGGDAGGNNWFVNFGSYGQRAAAESRAAKLQPTAGRVVVATGEKNGKTFYRVRVVELTNRETAQKVARQLESEHGLSKLWVGKQ